MAIRGAAAPWEVQLTNLQELLDPLDILRKYADIRIQDFYNKMLRNGWTLGSPQLMRVLQLVIRIYHRADGAAARGALAGDAAGHGGFVRAALQSRAVRKLSASVFPGRPFVTILTDIADYPPHFWIERQPQYLICGSDRAVAQARAMGHADGRIFRASGMILHPRFYEPPVEDPLAEREQLGIAARSAHGTGAFRRPRLAGHARNRRAAGALQARPSIDLDLRQETKSSRTRCAPRKWRMPRFVEGFTTRVNYYMQLADFFIGKPGPGSVSEALAMHFR